MILFIAWSATVVALLLAVYVAWLHKELDEANETSEVMYRSLLGVALGTHSITYNAGEITIEVKEDQ